MQRLLLLTVVTGALLAAPALATLGAGVSGTTHARGPIDVKVKVKEDAGTDFVTQQITIQPGGHTGWHSHPGAVLVIVKSGTFTYTGVSGNQGDQDDDGTPCFTRTYAAGQSFIDPGHGHVHIGRNLGTTPVELWATYTGVPSPTGAVRIDAPDPGC